MKCCYCIAITNIPLVELGSNFKILWRKVCLVIFLRHLKQTPLFKYFIAHAFCFFNNRGDILAFVISNESFNAFIFVFFFVIKFFLGFCCKCGYLPSHYLCGFIPKFYQKN